MFYGITIILISQQVVKGTKSQALPDVVANPKHSRGRRVTTGSVSSGLQPDDASAASEKAKKRRSKKQKNKTRRPCWRPGPPMSASRMRSSTSSHSCTTQQQNIFHFQHYDKKTHIRTNITAGRAARLLGKPWQTPRGPALLQSRLSLTERDKNSGWTAPVYPVYFTADAAANKCVSCNTVHLEN